MVKKGEVEMLGEDAQKLAIKLKVEGLSHSAIASRLNEEFNADITEDQVAGFCKRNRSKAFGIMKEQPDYNFKIAKWTFNAIDQMTALNKEMWKFFFEIKKTPELKDKIITCKKCGKRMVFQAQSYGLLIKIADHILRQIDIQNKKISDLSKNGITLNYNFNTMTNKINLIIPQLFHDAERQGDIRILRKKKYKLN